MAGPIFAVGDVHGCAPELHILLSELPLTPDSTIVFLGDLIDRGNYSREVITTVIDLAKQYNVVALRGNHEDMFLDFCEQRASSEAASYILNGGSSTLANYADERGNYEIPLEHYNFIRNMPFFYETNDYFFVHAGVPEIPLNDIRPEVHKFFLLWVRHPFLNSDYNWGKKIVHGHSPRKEPEMRKNRINVDTGCVFDGRLTAIEVNSGKLYSTPKSVKKEPRIYLRDRNSTRQATRFEGAITVQVDTPAGRLKFQTLNYNEFGVLLAEGHKLQPSLKMHQSITGSIGNEDHKKLYFKGQIVRVEQRRDQILYGVRMEKVVPADELGEP